MYGSLVGTRRSNRLWHVGRHAGAGRPGGSLTEWTARPLGRLGRPLLLEVEAYLHFYAIARAEHESDKR